MWEGAMVKNAFLWPAMIYSSEWRIKPLIEAYRAIPRGENQPEKFDSDNFLSLAPMGLPVDSHEFWLWLKRQAVFALPWTSLR